MPVRGLAQEFDRSAAVAILLSRKMFEVAGFRIANPKNVQTRSSGVGFQDHGFPRTPPVSLRDILTNQMHSISEKKGRSGFGFLFHFEIRVDEFPPLLDGGGFPGTIFGSMNLKPRFFNLFRTDSIWYRTPNSSKMRRRVPSEGCFGPDVPSCPLSSATIGKVRPTPEDLRERFQWRGDRPGWNV